MQKKNDGILFYLLLLTFFFLLSEVSFFIQCNKAYLFDFTFVANNLHVPAVILPDFIFFILAQLSLHVVYCLLVYAVVELISKRILIIKKNKMVFAVTVWCWGILTILTANQYYFPNSKFAVVTSLVLFNPLVTKIALSIFLTGCGIAAAAALCASRSVILFISMLILASFFWRMPQAEQRQGAASAARPNIILVGVDSLRPDFLSYFGSERRTLFFDSFLQKSTVFSEAVTPLARTFPSWSSILLGKYPRETSIRSNLTNQEHLNLSTSLPAILKRHGYETVFATDEVRFSNIDKNFGFDKIISPPMGLNDFLIGNFNDFPISNLLVNTAIGKWLFPYSYANRAVYFTYQPNSFLNLLKSGLDKTGQKPLFLAVHFCLTHHSYLWASLQAEELSAPQRYSEVVQRVDRQLKDFFVLLEKKHLLDHAVVVLLSDHGEALEFPADRITEEELFVSDKPGSPLPKFYPPSLDEEKINESAGHGTDVLGLPQYHTLLAFRIYGKEVPVLVPGIVSLLDIKPTVLNLLNLPVEDSSGISLLPIINHTVNTFPPARHVFLESDYSPPAIRTIYPETRNVFLEGVDLFQIDPVKARLSVKKSMMEKIIKSKQYADIFGEWMLALYPQSKTRYTPILINLNSGVWTNDLHSRFALQSPCLQMLHELKTFYGEELENF